ncbi:MAG: inositol-3-phosphate synthase [Planctomycetes bacterium]|nr:inositol-3-phosphate synthase [Planctomycetota bacterium]
MEQRVGVWLIGARGGVATTLIAGTFAIRKGLAGTHGVITETAGFRDLRLTPFGGLVFGGHDVRRVSLRESAAQIYRENGTIRHEILTAIGDDLDRADRDVRPGVLFRSGRAIESLDGVDTSLRAADPAAAVTRLADDIANFKKAHGLVHVVVVNLASTEPALAPDPEHVSAGGIERLLARKEGAPLIASTLYALAAARAGCAYINFTPSPGAFLPGVVEIMGRAGIPFFGSDGKTGETLVKSALAPLFKYRNLRVLSWQGYNLLGDRDGQVLADAENKSTKVASKDNLLHEFLGYPLHSRVEIDYVPSLNDFKTAWDFIHFQGFLDVKMSMQFTWQGCDSILAAPLVLDLVRMAALSLERGEAGPLTHLAIFFKNPLGAPGHDLHAQFHRLLGYVQSHSS